MVSIQPYNDQRAPQQSSALYSQGPPQQISPRQSYPPGHQHTYQQSPQQGHPQTAHVQHSQTHQTQYFQPHQHTSGQNPTYQSPLGHPVDQTLFPQQCAAPQQPSYQASSYGVAAPPTPAQHQQQYQQQAAQFAATPSAQGQLQSTAQSLLKSGKGFLGSLASNIKSKYPAVQNASTTPTASYTGEPPKPTYNPAQHPTQTPLSPANSFPLTYGQTQSQPQPGPSHHTPPTPQQSVSPAVSGYPPNTLPPTSFASPVQNYQDNPGKSSQPAYGQAQHAQQQPQQALQPQLTGIPGAIHRPSVQPHPVTDLPYGQPMLQHQQPSPYSPTPAPQGAYPHTQPAVYAVFPSHEQGSQVPSPQHYQQVQSPHLYQQSSWTQQSGSSGPLNPPAASLTTQSASQTAPHVGSSNHGPPDLRQQPHYHDQVGMLIPSAPTNAAAVSVQPAPTKAGSISQVKASPVVSPHQQAAFVQHYASSIPSTVSHVPPSVPYPAGHDGLTSHAQGPHPTQSPDQQHDNLGFQQHNTAVSLPQIQQNDPPPHAYHPQSLQEQVAQTGSVPGALSVDAIGQVQSIQAASQIHIYNPAADQRFPHTQYTQHPHQPTSGPINQQDQTSSLPLYGGHHDAVQTPQPSTVPAPITEKQSFQSYQAVNPLPNLNQSGVVTNNPSLDSTILTGHQLDTVDSLSAQMNSLNVQNDNQRPKEPGRDLASTHDGPRGPPPCQATGMASDTLPYCPEDRTVTYPLDWYRFIAVPQYTICTRCYADHVAGSYLAGHFERYHSPEGTASSCGFWFSHAREILWPQALQTRNVAHLQAFMEKSLTVPKCKGRVWSTGTDGVKWWGMVNDEIDGFISCEACYENNITGTAFASRFSPYRQQGQDEKWMCDLCIPYIAQIAVKMSKHNNWHGFIEAAKVRIGLPACEGRDEESNNGHWILPRRRIKDMTICEACYLDKLALTRFGNEFERHQRVEGFDAFLESIGQRWKCSLTDTAVNMSIALEAAIYRRDFEVFWNAANAICSLVPCTANGIVRGTWWTVAGGCSEYDVCEACYKGIVETSNLERFFEPAQRDPTIDIVCNWCPTSPRWADFITKFAEAIDKGIFSYYTDYVKKWAGVPTCPGIKSRDKSKWWGYPETLACQDCWLNFVADTPLGESVPVQAVIDERSLICQFWSPRMRNMWLAVCNAGPLGSPESQKALSDFRAFGTRRVQVYNATVPNIEMLQQMMTMKRMQAMHQGQLSLMYQAADSVASITGGNDGYLHGNSSIGYYETEDGVTAANMWNNMQAGMADANKMTDWIQIERLRAAWMEVE
ncbi:integral membrane protein [Fusarium heterosporum]|uniref:Integral membrane protein n=1 Tax=Fusarium heterosporum TaxID=42747 RepID=A0A8H5WRJ6_FUSHE|nr:integral membrane protein [Fusarium heterosporum]